VVTSEESEETGVLPACIAAKALGMAGTQQRGRVDVVRRSPLLSSSVGGMEEDGIEEDGIEVDAS
jgi:hypothetical protein